MGTDDLFKRRREERKKRRYEYKTPKANSYLIMTEGKCTEPFYFKGMQRHICEKIGGMVDVVEVPVIDIFGEGCATGTLIDKTDEIVSKANILYQNVWVIFDKDDFSYSDAALHRNEWNKKLDEIFGQYQLGNGRYEKNYENIYDILDGLGGVSAAIKHARSRMKNFDEKIDRPSEYDPGTTVYKLVEELKGYIDE